MLDFVFLDKGLGIVSPVHFVYNFSTHVIFYWLTKFHCLFAFTSWDIGEYCVLQLFVNQVKTLKNFKINLIFLIKPLLYMIKNSSQKLKYLENEKSF